MAMVVILLFLGVTGAVVPLTVTETAVSANHRLAVVALYAAEAGLEWVTHELGAVTDWSDVLAGGSTQAFGHRSCSIDCRVTRCWTWAR